MNEQTVSAALEVGAGTVAIHVAGPITAARLHVPAGTQIAARVAPQGEDVSDGQDVVSVAQAHEVLESWGNPPQQED